MRRGTALLLAAMLASGCGDDPPPPAAAPAEPTPEPAAPERDVPAAPTPIHRDAATPLAASEYWRAFAQGHVKQEEKADGHTYVVIEAGDGPRVIDDESLAAGEYKSLGYRAAIDDLVLALRDPETRHDAQTRLETLTKTERGSWEPWIRWHAEHGDFLVYDEDKKRVQVDDALMAEGISMAVDGIRVRLSTPDRMRRGHGWEITLDVANVGDDPRQLCQRFTVGHDIMVSLRRDDPDHAEPIELNVAKSPPPLTVDGFAVLEPGRDLSTRIDLEPLLPDLDPGQYRLQVTYQGMPLLAEMSPAAPAWAGEAASLSKRVRVVEW